MDDVNSSMNMMYSLPYTSPTDTSSSTIQTEDEENKPDPEFTSQYELFTRDIIKYRLGYLFNKSSCTMLCKHTRRRLPSGKAVYLVLFLCFLERLAYFAAVGNIIQPFLEQYHLPAVINTLVQSLSIHIVAYIMLPVAGWLADVWVGRYRMIHISLWLLFIGYASVALSFSIEAADSTLVNSPRSRNRYILPISFIVINLGSAGFQANTIPFGADQIIHKSSDELSSYFYCYYWVRNLGAVFLFVSFTCENFGSTLHGFIFGLISTLSISIALIFNALFKNWFHTRSERRNPIKMVGKVYYSAMVVKRPRNRSAFSYTGIEAPSRIDLVKKIHGGKFSSEEVEDAKTFGRLLAILLSLCGVLTVWNGIVYVIAVQARSMMGGKALTFSSGELQECTISDSFVWITNVTAVLILIPFLNQFLFPFLREYTPNMLKKIGIGYIFAILSSLSLVVIMSVGQGILQRDGQLHNATKTCMFIDDDKLMIRLPVHAGVAILPHILITVAEVFVNVSSLEFFYAQSPHTMRGLMVGLFFFMWGITDSFANAIIGGFSLRNTGPPLLCGFWYHLLMLIFATGGFVIFILVARWYKNRMRPVDQENEQYYIPQ